MISNSQDDRSPWFSKRIFTPHAIWTVLAYHPTTHQNCRSDLIQDEQEGVQKCLTELIPQMKILLYSYMCFGTSGRLEMIFNSIIRSGRFSRSIPMLMLTCRLPSQTSLCRLISTLLNSRFCNCRERHHRCTLPATQMLPIQLTNKLLMLM